MASINVVRARIDRHIKKKVSNVLARVGLSASAVIRLRLNRFATDRELPIDINAVTKAGRKKS